MSQAPGREDLRRMAEQTLADPKAERNAVVGGLRGLRERMLEAACSEFAPRRAGTPLSRFLRQGCDAMVANAVQHVEAHSPPADGALTAWVATGGYGTGLMSPASTVRLALLHEAADPAGPGAIATDVAALLREAGLPAACAARTVPELARRMETDAETALTLLETRRAAGSRKLYGALHKAIREELLPRCWGSLFEEILTEMLARRDPFTGSPYCTEPNLKEGFGCLRDIGAARKISAALGLVPAARPHLGDGTDGLLTTAEKQVLGRALNFILRARNTLHLLAPTSHDLLHRHVQSELAHELGLGPGDGAAAALLEQLFRHTGRVAGILRALNERFLHVHHVAWRRSRTLSHRNLGNGFVEVEGYIYSAGKPAFPLDRPAAAMLGLFRLSQRRHLPVSQHLLNEVTAHLDAVTEQFRRDEEAGQAFREMLAGSVGVAERLAWMRDCGLLQAYIPEFAPLVHAVHADAAGELTLDEHAIEAVRVIDELIVSKEPGEVPQRQSLQQVERTDLLRLLILLHDVGPATGENPAPLAVAIAERLGMRRSEGALLAHLMGLHRLLWDQTLSGEELTETDLKELAGRIGDAENLRQLYLLTYAHGRAMGSLGWFAWREPRLFELYQDLMAAIVPDYRPVATSDYFDRELLRRAAREGIQPAAERFARLVPEMYKTLVSPAAGLEHVRMLERLNGQTASMSWKLRDRQAVAWVCTSDVPARFAQIAGVFTYNGLDILSAKAFTLSDGTVLDRFVVRTKDRPINPDPRFWQKVERDLVQSIEGRLDISHQLRGRAAQAHRNGDISSHRSLTTVHFDNKVGLPFTALDVVARDRVGLLYTLAEVLGGAGLNIELAQIRTRGELARDVFFVTDARSGWPVTDESRLESLREAIARVTE